MPPFFEGSNPQRPFSIIKKGPRWDPSLKLNWQRAGDVRACYACPPASKPGGFSPTGYKRFRVCLTPVPSRVRIPSLLSPHKKGPKWDPSSNSYWRRAGDSNPRCPFGAYSLSRRAPSASRSALRNSRSIVTKQPKLSKREFSNCLAAFPPCSFRPYPSERLREPSSSLPMVRHIWKMQPRARKKKPLSTSCTAASAS